MDKKIGGVSPHPRCYDDFGLLLYIRTKSEIPKIPFHCPDLAVHLTT